MKSTRAIFKEIKVYLQGFFEIFYSVCVNGGSFHNYRPPPCSELCIAFNLDNHKYDFYEQIFI